MDGLAPLWNSRISKTRYAMYLLYDFYLICIYLVVQYRLPWYLSLAL